MNLNRRKIYEQLIELKKPKFYTWTKQKNFKLKNISNFVKTSENHKRDKSKIGDGHNSTNILPKPRVSSYMEQSSESLHYK